MKKKIICFFLAACCLGLTSMAAHKYYVSVFQMDYAPEKKVIRMTARIFIDDFEATLNKKYNRKFYFGSSQEDKDATTFLKTYLSEKIAVKVNGKAKAITYLGRETEEDVLVCYYTIPAEGKIKSIWVRNIILTESYPEQQNIIHTNINSNKKSLMLTNDKKEGTLEF